MQVIQLCTQNMLYTNFSHQFECQCWWPSFSSHYSFHHNNGTTHTHQRACTPQTSALTMPHIYDDEQLSRDHVEDAHYHGYYHHYDEDQDSGRRHHHHRVSRSNKRSRSGKSTRRNNEWSPPSPSLISPSSSFSPKKPEDDGYYDNFFHGAENDGWYGESGATGRRERKSTRAQRDDYPPYKRYRVDTSTNYLPTKDDYGNDLFPPFERDYNDGERRKEPTPFSHHPDKAKLHEKKSRKYVSNEQWLRVAGRSPPHHYFRFYQRIVSCIIKMV